MDMFGRVSEAYYTIISDLIFSLREVVELLKKRVQKLISIYAKCAKVWEWNKEQVKLPM